MRDSGSVDAANGLIRSATTAWRSGQRQAALGDLNEAIRILVSVSPSDTGTADSSGTGVPASDAALAHSAALRARSAIHGSAGDFSQAVSDAEASLKVDEASLRAAARENATGDIFALAGSIPPGGRSARIVRSVGLSLFRVAEAVFLRGLSNKSADDFADAAARFRAALALPAGSSTSSKWVLKSNTSPGSNNSLLSPGERERVLSSMEQCEYYRLHLLAESRQTRQGGSASAGGGGGVDGESATQPS